MTPTLKSLPTNYHGVTFRSRLEARWAVFFDHLRLPWQYEPEGFDLGNGVCYLPDFRVSTKAGDFYLEIKPTPNLSPCEIEKAVRFSSLRTVGDPLYRILAGMPCEGAYQILTVHANDTVRPDHDRHWAHCPLCGHVSLSIFNPDISDGEEAVSCIFCDCIDRGHESKETPGTYFHKGDVITNRLGFITSSPTLRSAYAAARSERFGL